MSSADSDRFLKIATFAAIVVAIVGGSFYFGAMLRNDEGGGGEEVIQREVQVQPARTATAPVRTGSSTSAASEPATTAASDSPIQPHRDPMSGALLDMATRPTVLPDSELAGVEDELELVLQGLDRCWRGAVGDNATEGRVYLHFSVDENGEVADLSVRNKGIGVPSVNTCFTDVVSKRVYGDTEPGTSVYWPIILDPESGPRLR